MKSLWKAGLRNSEIISNLSVAESSSSKSKEELIQSIQGEWKQITAEGFWWCDCKYA
jgi:hypothetical protein